MKFFTLFYSFLFLSIISFAQRPNLQKMDYHKMGAPLPPFVLQKTAGGVLTNTDLKKGKSVMLVIFSPQCDHCEHMMDSLKTLAAKFKNTELVLVAEDRNKEYMKGFIQKTNIGTNPLFKNVGTERGNLIAYIYNYKLLPQVNFYNRNYKLLKTFSGSSPLDSIKMFIR